MERKKYMGGNGHVFSERGTSPFKVLKRSLKTITISVNGKAFMFRRDSIGFKRQGQYLYSSPEGNQE